MPENREIEIKFLLTDPDNIVKKLEALGAQYHGEVFQKNLSFDTPDKKVDNNGGYLRVRSAGKNTITLKSKLKTENPRFKEEKELEVEIGDADKMALILEELGFTKKRMVEKYRKDWSFEGAEISMDRLPFATYLEIEGSEESIENAAEKLGLKIEDGSVESYGHIWREYKKAHGIEKHDILFEDSAS